MKKIRFVNPRRLIFRFRFKYKPLFYKDKTVEIIEQSYDAKSDTVIIVYDMRGKGQRLRPIIHRVTMEVAQALLEGDRETQRIARQNRRRISRIPECVWDNLEHPLEARDPVGESVLRSDEIERLCEYIAQLPDIQRRRLIAYYFNDLTYRQIADLESVDHSAIVNSVKRALKKIKKMFEEGSPNSI